MSSRVTHLGQEATRRFPVALASLPRCPPSAVVLSPGKSHHWYLQHLPDSHLIHSIALLGLCSCPLEHLMPSSPRFLGAGPLGSCLFFKSTSNARR